MFEDAFREIAGRLERATQGGLLRAYGLIGGFASAVHGVPRSTEDIDFVVIPATQDSKQLAGILGGEFRPGGADDHSVGFFMYPFPDEVPLCLSSSLSYRYGGTT